jgi:hypothetical protein
MNIGAGVPVNPPPPDHERFKVLDVTRHGVNIVRESNGPRNHQSEWAGNSKLSGAFAPCYYGIC